MAVVLSTSPKMGWSGLMVILGVITASMVIVLQLVRNSSMDGLDMDTMTSLDVGWNGAGTQFSSL